MPVSFALPEEALLQGREDNTMLFSANIRYKIANSQMHVVVAATCLSAAPRSPKAVTMRGAVSAARTIEKSFILNG